MTKLSREPLVRGREEKKWWEKPNRLLLINLREGDEAKLDAEDLVQTVKRFDATAFSINGGGIVSFYQSEIPGHRKSKGLGERDLLAEVIPVAKRNGLKVLARIDPSCGSRELAERHPDWFSRDRDGNLYAVSGHYVTCPNGEYYHTHMMQIVRELLTNYDLDGLWNNQGKFSAWDTGTCYCSNCRTLFRRDTGHSIPEAEDWNDPVWLKFNEWRYRRIAEWVRRAYETKNEVRPGAIWTAAVQVMESWDFIRPGGWDVDYWVPYQDVVTVEAQRRYTVPWWPGAQAKYLRTIAPDKPRWMTASYFYPWWRLYSAPEEENRFWIAQQFANGTSSWLHINGGYSDYFDRRGYDPTQAIFRRLSEWESYFEDATSEAQVALVYSRFTQDNLAGEEPDKKYLDHFRGYYGALLEDHIPFDVLSDKNLGLDTLRRYKTIVLPNVGCLSDESAEALKRYVAEGGGLVATFQTSMYGEMGRKRESPALEEVFGGEFLDLTRDNLKSSYAKVETPHDFLLQGIGDTDLLPNDGSIVYFAPNPDREVPLTLIPPVQAHAGSTISIPEYSAISVTTSHPIALYGDYEAGRVVYFPNQMDLLFYRYGFRDLGTLLANAVRYGLRGENNIEISAPDYVDVSYMSQQNRKLVHLINFPVGKNVNSGWRRPGQNLVPVRDVQVRLRTKQAETVKKVRTLNNQASLEFSACSDWIEVTVPELLDHEIVVFELESKEEIYA
jgi:hypothetical protein